MNGPSSWAASGFRDAIKAMPTSALRRKRDLGALELTRVADRLATANSSPLSPLDLNEIAQRCFAAFNGGSGQGLSPRDRRQAPWCLWQTEPALAKSSGGAIYLDSLEHADRPELKRLAAVYIRQFTADNPLIDRVAGLLRRRVNVLAEPWAELDRRIQLFDPQIGPARLAAAAIEDRCPPQEVLTKAGLGEVVAHGGFAEAAFVRGLRELRNRSVTKAAEHLNLVRAWALRADGRWISERHNGAIANALAVPLADLPNNGTREAATEFLLKELKDPRLFGHNWIAADEAKLIVARWLTQRSLQEFLDVVDRQVQHDLVARNQWRYRRAFWEGLFDHPERPISKAWVVFNAEAAALAKRITKDTQTFGTFSSGGNSGHSVLLLQVGSCVVAEWSGNGRCHIWNDELERGCPRFNQRKYVANELRRNLGRTDEATCNSYGSFSHSGSENYLWQRRVAAYLMRKLPIRIDRSHYEV